ncbi:CLUMA_CG006636, isoform A [Clunio marinus]|uniref:CLUMA_CG006636, isoform A n=1 Tax=Clunio marinus TaxID=568069 RepID=A0A1J1I453_9DIPT|nr:CLUMA_CG006636, isoform A [Clunio marinus]
MQINKFKHFFYRSGCPSVINFNQLVVELFNSLLINNFLTFTVKRIRYLPLPKKVLMGHKILARLKSQLQLTQAAIIYIELKGKQFHSQIQ